MTSKCGIAVLIVLAVTTAASAQVTMNASVRKTTAAGPERTVANVDEQLKQKLSREGFSDVQIVQGSRLVTATDKGGRPVTMIIAPHNLPIFSDLR